MIFTAHRIEPEIVVTNFWRLLRRGTLIGSKLTAADVKSSKIVWVKESITVGDLVRTMLSQQINCLPVLDDAPEAGGKILGMIKRTSIIRLLVRSNQDKSEKRIN